MIIMIIHVSSTEPRTVGIHGTSHHYSDGDLLQNPPKYEHVCDFRHVITVNVNDVLNRFSTEILRKK